MDLRDFFHRRCSEMLVMEREVWQLHSVMMQESSHPRLREWLEQHNEPKRQQISNLEQVVDDLGGIVGLMEHPVTQSVRRMHRQFMELNPLPALVDLQNGLEADKLAHMTAAGYVGLLELARSLNEGTMTRLLEANLQLENDMRLSLASVLPDLLSEAGGPMRRAA